MIGVILQARMNSTRLPGKVLAALAGRPMIEHVVRRLRRVRRAKRLIVATGDSPADDAIARWADAAGVACFRGSEPDVLDRFYRCARRAGLTTIVRATADNPLVDPGCADALIDAHLAGGFDLSTSKCEYGSGLPDGVGLDVLSFEALATSWREATAPAHREHVDEYVWAHPDAFRTLVWAAPPALRRPELSLTVDTPDDRARVAALLARLGPDTSLADLVADADSRRNRR